MRLPRQGILAIHPTELLYSLVAGSGTAFPGNDDFRNSIVHCGRTRNSPNDAGIITPSPFATVNGSMPGASTTPQPSTTTRICTELLLDSSTVRKSLGSFNSNISTTKYGEVTSGERRFLVPGTALGAGRITFPDATFSFSTESPSCKCSSRGRP